MSALIVSDGKNGKKVLPVWSVALREWRAKKDFTRVEAGKVLDVPHRTLEMLERGRKPGRMLWKVIARKIGATKIDIDESARNTQNA